MTLPNHLAGGLVFTGFFAALANINILESPATIGAVLLGATLPDIDHPRSPIGRLFLPLSRYLNSRHGHRTLTHSLLGLGIFWLAAGLLEQTLWQSQRLTAIAVIAMVSHLLFDMVTLQGVLLFYPFLKNPCVLPGDPNMRIRTGDMRKETIWFFAFILGGLASQPLYKQGFWTTYNRTFGTLKHLASEFKKSSDVLEVDYRYHEGSQVFQGKALCIEARESKATLLKDGQFLLLDKSKQIIHHTIPRHTGRSFRFEELLLVEVGLDSINKLLHQQLILEVKLHATDNFVARIGGQMKEGQQFSAKYLSDLVIMRPQATTAKEAFVPQIDPRIEVLRVQVQNLRQADRAALAEYRNLMAELANLEAMQPSDDIYLDQKRTQRIKELRKVKIPELHEARVIELETQLRELQQDNRLRNLQQAAELEVDWARNLPGELLFTGVLKVVRI
ncbi:metal-dependent hydrolase [Haliscomenobacter sp.]|uniref:metal-dependent hydrolase n=1 Tax=Haliscomenobacter sp. TaxID=2717303 RepID=UPI003593C07D